MAQQDANEKAFSQIGVAPAAAPPAAPAAQPAAVPGEADFAKIGVAPAAPATQNNTDANAGGLAARSVEGAYQFAAPIAAIVKPPENATEEVINGVGGPGALGAYRAARGLVGSVQNIVNATPENYANAINDYKRAHQELINHDYRNAASSAASLATDAAHVLDPTLLGHNDARELTEGARPGGNLATPLVRQGLTAGTALLGAEGAGAEGRAAAGAAEEAPSLFRRLIVNPFRRAIATPTEAGEAAETAVGTAGTRSALNSGGRTLLQPLEVDTPLTQAKNLYQTVDKAAGTNIKDMYEKLENAQDRAMQTVDGSAEEAKAMADVKAQEDAIAQVKQRAEQGGVPNVDKVLKQADKKFTEAQANKEFNYKFQNAVEGDVAHGAKETVDVDKAISIARKMSQPTVKYPTPRLYQTTVGKEGADRLLSNLYAAKKAGEKAVELRTIRNWTLGAAATAGGVGYELMKP